MNDSTKNKNVTIRLSDEQHRRIAARLGSKGHKFQWLLESYLEWYSKTGITPWTETPSTPPQAIRPDRQSPYRKPNIPWHDRLELVLNDAGEAPGARKYLEFAENNVQSKSGAEKSSGS